MREINDPKKNIQTTPLGEKYPGKRTLVDRYVENSSKKTTMKNSLKKTSMLEISKIHQILHLLSTKSLFSRSSRWKVVDD